MNPEKDYLIRYIIRKRRKELGLRQEDIEGVSKSTVSNLESGRTHVEHETYIHILEQLDLYPKEKLVAVINQEKKRMEQLQFRLHCIQNILRNGRLTTAKARLDALPIEEYHPLAPLFHFLKGTLYYKKKEWQKADKCFLHGVRLCNQYNMGSKDNIVSSCYNRLVTSSFNQNNLEQALTYVKQGLKALDLTQEKAEIQFYLYANQVLCLLRSSEYDQASQILHDIWPLLPQIKRMEIVLDFYKHRATLFRIKKTYEEAIRLCKEGLEIAQKENIQRRYLDLMLVLGSIYLEQQELEEAHHCFQTVLDSDPDCEYQRRHIDAHNYLAIYYTRQQEFQQAEQHLNQSLEMAREVDDILRLTKVLILKGNNSVHQEQYKEAVPYYKEAIQLAEKHYYPRRQHSALLKLIECFDKMGKTEERANCLEALYQLQCELNMRSEDELYEI